MFQKCSLQSRFSIQSTNLTTVQFCACFLVRHLSVRLTVLILIITDMYFIMTMGILWNWKIWSAKHRGITLCRPTRSTTPNAHSLIVWRIFICECIPNYNVKINTRDKPGMTKQIKVLFIRRANRLHRKAIKTQLPVDIEKHRTARRLAKSIWKSAQFTYYHKPNQKLSDPKTSSKAWWKLNKNEMGLSKCSSIPPLIIDGNLLTDGIAKCESFNEFFPLNVTCQCLYMLMNSWIFKIEL